MTADIIYLQNKQGKHQYPVTSSEAVGMSDGSGSLDDKFTKLENNLSNKVEDGLSIIYNKIDDEIYAGTTGNILKNDTCFRLQPVRILANVGETIAWVGVQPAYTVFLNDAFPSREHYVGNSTSVNMKVPEGAKYAAAYFRKAENTNFKSAILFQPIEHWLKYFNRIEEDFSDTLKVGQVFINAKSYPDSLRLVAGLGTQSCVTIPFLEGGQYSLKNSYYVYRKKDGLMSALYNYPEMYNFQLSGISGQPSKSTTRKSSGYINLYNAISAKVTSSEYQTAQILYYNDLTKQPLKYIISVSDSITFDSNYKYARVCIKKKGDAEFNVYDNNELEIICIDSNKIIQLENTTKSLVSSNSVLEKQVNSFFTKKSIPLENVGFVSKALNYKVDVDQNWINSNFIQLNNNDIIYASLKGSKSGNVVLYSFYKTPSPDGIISGSNTDLSFTGYIKSIPPESKYIRFSGASSKFGQYTPIVEIKQNLTSQLTTKVDDLTNQIGNTTTETNIDITQAGYVDKQAGYNTNTDKNWVHSDFVELKEGMTFKINLHGSRSGSGNVILYSFYTEKDYRTYIDGNGDKSFNGILSYFPPTAKYIRFSGASPTFDQYSPYVISIISESTIARHTDEINEMQTQLNSIITDKDYIDESLQLGMIDTKGNEVFNGDANWNRTNFMPLAGIMSISYKVKASKGENALFAFYSSKGNTPIHTINMKDGAILQGTLTEFPKGANYFRASFGSEKFSHFRPVLISHGLNVPSSSTSTNEPIVDTLLYPTNVYLVCNDINSSSPYSRNTTPAIYADHFFENLNEEKDIKFSDGGIRQAFKFKTKPTSNWTCELNSNSNIDIFTKKFILTGNNAPAENSFNTTIISTKATVSKNKTPLVLTLGSSTVYGEGATYLTNGMNNVKPYHAICMEYFKKDNIDQKGGNNCITLGTLKHPNLSMTYKDQLYTYDDYHEGYRGMGVNGFMQMQKFVDENGQFSLLAWVKQYRTLDDNGERLYFDAHKLTTGSAGTSNKAYLANGQLATDSNGQQLYIGSKVTNTTSYNVCIPTHVIWHLGANGGATKEQIQTLVDTTKRAFPNAYIALGMNDSMGTIFPTYYKADYTMCRWNITDGGDNRHKQNFKIQKVYQDYFDNEECKNNKIYVLPFFFVSNPTYFASRIANLPEYEYSNKEGKLELSYGWYSATHADVRAHSNYAYQLYSWIKYTLTKE